MKKTIITTVLALVSFIGISQLSEHINQDHYRVIAIEEQKTQQSPAVISRYLPDIWVFGAFIKEYRSGENGIFDTNSDGNVNTMDFLRWIGGYNLHAPAIGITFDKLELDMLFGEGNQFLNPVDTDGPINFAILHKKFIGEDAGKPNDTWDLVHFELEVLWNDGSRSEYLMLRR